MTNKIEEASVVTPMFIADDDGENAVALQLWAQAIGVIVAAQSLCIENTKSFYLGLSEELGIRLMAIEKELNPAPPAVPVPHEVPVAPMPAPAPAPVAPTAQVVDLTAESVETNEDVIKRFRELAGIPHPKNRV